MAAAKVRTDVGNLLRTARERLADVLLKDIIILVKSFGWCMDQTLWAITVGKDEEAKVM